jgi:hypothetical protein
MAKLPLDEWSLAAIASHLRKAISTGHYRLWVERHAVEELEADGLDRDEIPD